MAINTAPIFSGIGQINWGSTDGDGGASGPLLTANTNRDGTSTVLTVFTAAAAVGGFVREVRFRAVGTNTATVARIFINNGSTNATIANNILVGEITLSATTASAVAALQDYTFPLMLALPAGYRVMVTLGTTVIAGYFVSCIGGSYVAQ